MTAKIHINLSQGILEVEGEPEFVRGIFDDFKADLKAVTLEAPSAPMLTFTEMDTANVNAQEAAKPKEKQVSEKKSKEEKKKSGTKKESYSYLKDLNTGLPDQPDSLNHYLTIYNPTSNVDRNLVFMHYLKEQHPDLSITLDHVYTCYRNAEMDLPGSLYESFKLTASPSKGNGYVDKADPENLGITYKGDARLVALKKAVA